MPVFERAHMATQYQNITAKSDMYNEEVFELTRPHGQHVPYPQPEREEIKSLSWYDIHVTVNDQKSREMVNILSNVSGHAQAGEMMALMGPSGSGKTTLLNALAQRQGGSTTGQLYINGQIRSLATHRALSAYVEQEDTLIGSLTTKETLQFAAELTISRTTPKAEVRERIDTLIREFGLPKQANTLIGTPFRKGLSGGQKRRVSVASHLITSPKVLFLDEPTSGLDSTASYEVMAFIKRFAEQNKLIVIASIHQPSTKTFNLFDQVTLLSRGRVCYSGSKQNIPQYFAQIGVPIPGYMNPAEHMLDLVNTDFIEAGSVQDRLGFLIAEWERSMLYSQLIHSIRESMRKQYSSPLEAIPDQPKRPSSVKQVMTLLRRSFIKSYRDIVVYWIRLVMYMGLAIMMGTVWLRLKTDQAHIQAFINAIFFGSAFMSFMAVAYVPAFLEDRTIFVKERANGLYGSTVFMVSNFLIGVPYLFLISVLFSLVAYWLSNFNPTAHSFFMWILWLFLDLLAAESLVILVTSIIPNFVAALAIVAFANGLWMSVGGFLISLPNLNVFWKYVFHYWDYQAYVFQGMMVNEFQYRNYDCAVTAEGDCQCMYGSPLPDQCKSPGTAVLQQYGYDTNLEARWIGIMLVIIFAYRLAGWLVTYLRKT